MGGQDKREQAIRRHKRNREQAAKRVQQRKQQQQPRPQPQQPPARTQQQPPARTQQQPRVVLPEFTDRANKLGDLIALYLTGDWDYNTGMQVARQYAPNGTTEGELRAAVVRAAQAQGKQGNLAIRALVQPEVVHPQVNISDLPKQSTLQNIARGLQAPLRSVSAGATQLAARRNPRGQYGRESGGKPFPAPQSFAESYASDPTFGSALELAFPNSPQWLRVLVGGALDFVLDPVNLMGAGSIKNVVGTTGRTVARNRTVQAITKPITETAGAVGTRAMHPTAAKTLQSIARTAELSKKDLRSRMAELGKTLEKNTAYYSYPRIVGSQMVHLRKEVDDIIREASQHDARLLIPIGSGSVELLDFGKHWSNVYEGKVLAGIRSAKETLEENLQQYITGLQGLKTRLDNIADTRIRERLQNRLQNVIDELEQKKPAWLRHAELLDKQIDDTQAIYQLPAFRAGQAVYEQEVKPSTSIVNRAIDAWKRTKTVYNLGTHTRNFFQNFLFRYLTGEADIADLIRLPNTIGDIIRLRRMVDAGRLDPEQYSRLAHKFMLTKTNVSPSDMRDIIAAVRLGNRTARSLVEALPPSVFIGADDVIRAGTLASEKGIPVRDLPSSWLDVITYPFTRLRNIVRTARSKNRSVKDTVREVIHNAAVRAYNAGDLIPALLMEAARRERTMKPTINFTQQLADTIARRTVTSSPYRMDYAGVPELIGRLNIALLPFFNYQYFALRGLRTGLRNNPERIYNILMKPIERSTRITQSDEQQGVSQAPRFGFAEREQIPITDTRGLPYSSVYPIDPHFAEPILSPASWVSRSPLTAIARPFVLNRDDILGMLSGTAREFTPPSMIHAWYALMGEPQRGMKPTLEHTRTERLLRALGINIQPIDQMRIARQQQRMGEQERREQLQFDPAQIADWVKQILRRFGM